MGTEPGRLWSRDPRQDESSWTTSRKEVRPLSELCFANDRDARRLMCKRRRCRASPSPPTAERARHPGLDAITRSATTGPITKRLSRGDIGEDVVAWISGASLSPRFPHSPPRPLWSVARNTAISCCQHKEVFVAEPRRLQDGGKRSRSRNQGGDRTVVRERPEERGGHSAGR